eukprot:10326921-Ditylum_brightwellii.AAC.1
MDILCTNSKLQLSKSCTCPGCKGMVHVPCGSFDEKLDLQWHKLCTSKPSVKPSEEKKHEACGGTDHLCKSSSKCYFNPPNVSSKASATKRQNKPQRGGKDKAGVGAKKMRQFLQEEKCNHQTKLHTHCNERWKKYTPVVDVASESFVDCKTTLK